MVEPGTGGGGAEGGDGSAELGGKESGRNNGQGKVGGSYLDTECSSTCVEPIVTMETLVETGDCIEVCNYLWWSTLGGIWWNSFSDTSYCR